MTATSFLCLIICARFTAYESRPGNPFSVPGKERGFVFDLRVEAAAARPHPWLFISRAEIATAREAARGALAGEFRQLVRDAEAALGAAGAAPEEGWYDAVKGRPFDAVYPEVYARTAREPAAAWRPIVTMARAWALSGRAEFLAPVVAQLRAWADYRFAVEHYDVGLNYAIWVLMALECCDLVFDELAPGDHAALAGFFGRALGAVLRNDCFWLEYDIGGGLNNHLAWHRYAAGAIGLFWGETAAVDFTRNGARSPSELAERGLRDGGLWLEGSIPYHLTAQYPLIAVLRLYRRAGLDLPPPAGGRSFQDFYRGPARVVFPDLVLPPLGDAYGARSYLPDAGAWRLAAELWPDGLAAYMLSRRVKTDPWETLTAPPLPARPEPPVLASELFTEHGYAVLRVPEGPPSPAQAMVLATYDAAGVHGHADKLSFMLFAGGKLRLEDREAVTGAVHSFSSDIQRTLNRHTICHNAMLVDWRAQRGAAEKLDLVGFRRGEGFACVTLADFRGRLYEGVRQMRSLVLLPDACLDILTAAADREAAFVLALHPAGELAGAALEWREAALPEGRPWSWLARPRKIERAGTARFPFADGADRFTVLSVCPPATAAWLIDFPTRDDGSAHKPLLLRVATGDRARFVHLFFFGAGPEPSVECRELGGDRLLRVALRRPGAAEQVFILPDLP